MSFEPKWNRNGNENKQGRTFLRQLGGLLRPVLAAQGRLRGMVGHHRPRQSSRQWQQVGAFVRVCVRACVRCLGGRLIVLLGSNVRQVCKGCPPRLLGVAVSRSCPGIRTAMLCAARKPVKVRGGACGEPPVFIIVVRFHTSAPGASSTRRWLAGPTA